MVGELSGCKSDHAMRANAASVRITARTFGWQDRLCSVSVEVTHRKGEGALSSCRVCLRLCDRGRLQRRGTAATHRRSPQGLQGRQHARQRTGDHRFVNVKLRVSTRRPEPDSSARETLPRGVEVDDRTRRHSLPSRTGSFPGTFIMRRACTANRAQARLAVTFCHGRNGSLNARATSSTASP